MPPAAPGGVDVIAPDGTVRTLAPESAKNVLSENVGYLPATPENLAHLKVVQENSGVGSTLLAGLEGTASGLTSGLSDLAEVKAGLTTPEAIAARQEGNPGTAHITNMLAHGARTAAIAAAGTAAALALAPVGIGAAGLAALGMGGGMLAAGAAGAASGATEELSRQALGPTPLVGEQVAQQALYGGIEDALSVPFGKLGGMALSKLFKGAAGLAGFAERQAVRATGATGAQLTKLADKGLTDDVGRQILDRGYLGKGFTDFGNSAATAQGMAAADREVAGKAIGGILATSEAEPGTLSLAGELRALAEPGKMELSPKPWKDALGKAARLLDQHGAGPDKRLPMAAMQEVKAEIDDLVSAFPKGKIPAGLATARRLVSQTMEQALPEQEQVAYVAAKQQFGLAKEAAKLLQRSTNKEASGTAGGILSSAKDPGLVMSTYAGGPGGAAAYLSAKFASKVKTFGNVARAADYMSTTRLVQGLAKGATGQWDGALQNVLTGAASGAAHSITLGRYDDIAQGVEQAAQDPQALTGTIQASLGHDMTDHHPEIATTAALTMQRAFKYLDDSRPKAPYAPTPYDSAYTPPNHVKAQWLDKVRAVANPASVATNPTPDSLAALQAVYPETYNAVVAQMQDTLARHGPQLPYRAKLLATQFLGMPVSTLTDARLGARMQQLYMAADPAKQQNASQQSSARTQGARTMRIKQIAEDDTTAVGHMLARSGTS